MNEQAQRHKRPLEDPAEIPVGKRQNIPVTETDKVLERIYRDLDDIDAEVGDWWRVTYIYLNPYLGPGGFESFSAGAKERCFDAEKTLGKEIVAVAMHSLNFRKHYRMLLPTAG